MDPSVCFKIEKIIDVSTEGSIRNFKVQWAPMWVPSLYLIGCEKLMGEFLVQKDDSPHGCNVRMPEMTGAISPEIIEVGDDSLPKSTEIILENKIPPLAEENFDKENDVYLTSKEAESCAILVSDGYTSPGDEIANPNFEWAVVEVVEVEPAYSDKGCPSNIHSTADSNQIPQFEPMLDDAFTVVNEKLSALCDELPALTDERITLVEPQEPVEMLQKKRTKVLPLVKVKCDACGNLFRDKEKLNLHKEKVHTGTVDKENMNPIEIYDENDTNVIGYRLTVQDLVQPNSQKVPANISSNLANTKKRGRQIDNDNGSGEKDVVVQKDHDGTKIERSFKKEAISPSSRKKYNMRGMYNQKDITEHNIDQVKSHQKESVTPPPSKTEKYHRKVKSNENNETLVVQKEEVVVDIPETHKELVSSSPRKKYSMRGNLSKKSQHVSLNESKLTNPFGHYIKIEPSKPFKSSKPIVKLHRCDGCGVSFTSDNAYTSHCCFHCTICQEIFSNESLFEKHFKRHISDNNDSQVEVSNASVCNGCGLSFVYEKSFEKHRCFSCTFCKKVFVGKLNFDRHFSVHTGGVTKYLMKEVKKEHLCSICGQGFAHEVGLRNHICATCTICGHIFKRKAHLNRHMLTHSSESLHQCTLCNKDFLRKDTLTSHMKTHC